MSGEEKKRNERGEDGEDEDTGAKKKKHEKNGVKLAVLKVISGGGFCWVHTYAC